MLPGNQFPWSKKPNGKSYPNRICKECQRWEKIKKKYGITKEMWWDLWGQQNGIDPITQEKLDSRKCHVDHCHKTGKIRGLLNGSTNRALGFFREDPEAFRRAIDYLAGTPIFTPSAKEHASESGIPPEGS